MGGGGTLGTASSSISPPPPPALFPTPNLSFGRSAPAGTKCAMLASAVSSKMLKAVAEKEGFLFEETLTGFKWIGENQQRKPGRRRNCN